MKSEDQEKNPAARVKLDNGAEATLRPLSVADGEALAEFYSQVPRQDVRFYFPHPLDRAHALSNASRADSPLEVVIVLATPRGRIAGYAWYRWQDGDEISRFGICIRPDHQGLGAGRALMERICRIARAVGPPVISLTVQKANRRAIALYKRMGFRIVRSQMRGPIEAHGFPSEPEYYMERQAR